MPARKRRSEKRTVTEKRWGLCWPGKGGVTVGPKGYPKYAATFDAKMQKAVVVEVTLTYELPLPRGD